MRGGRLVSGRSRVGLRGRTIVGIILERRCSGVCFLLGGKGRTRLPECSVDRATAAMTMSAKPFVLTAEWMKERPRWS